MEQKTKPCALTTLLPCPHCGGEPQELQHDCQFWIQCKKCYGVDGQTCVHTSEAEAVAAWNKRFACVAGSQENWSDDQVVEFLSVALRHVNLSGAIAAQDVRDGFRLMAAKYGQAARIAELERKLEQAEQIINRECQAAAAYRMQALELELELEAFRKDAERLRTLLVEASETIEEWGAYADDYFKEKHGLARDVAYYRGAAMKEGSA